MATRLSSGAVQFNLRVLRGATVANLDLAADDAGVVTAEAEAVVHGGLDLALHRRVGRIVQIASRVGFDEIDSRRYDVVVDSQGGEDHFDAATGAQRVAQVAFGAGRRTVCRACSPYTAFIACVSALSPSGVLVPCALI